MNEEEQKRIAIEQINLVWRMMQARMDALYRELDEEFLYGDSHSPQPVGLLASESPEIQELERLFNLESPK